MGLSASYIRILVDGGKSVEDIITVAQAMECGPDAGIIYAMVDAMGAVETPAEAMAIAMCEVAEHINQKNAVRTQRVQHQLLRDGHTASKDSNRSRRGMPDSEWRALRSEIFTRDGHQCQYCGATDDLTCDHIVPLVRGGKNDNDNLATACRSCNSSKGDKLLEEWPRYGN